MIPFEPYTYIDPWPEIKRTGLFSAEWSLCGVDGETEESVRRVRELLWGPNGSAVQGAAPRGHKESDAAQKRTGASAEVGAGRS